MPLATSIIMQARTASGHSRWLAASPQRQHVANDAIEGTKGLVAKRGRQQFTGDRSIGTPDPGIVAIATMMNDICAEFGVATPASSHSNN